MAEQPRRLRSGMAQSQSSHRWHRFDQYHGAIETDTSEFILGWRGDRPWRRPSGRNADRVRMLSCARPPLAILGKQTVELGPGGGLGQTVELAVARDEAGGAHEAAPSRAREPAAEADAATAKRRNVRNREPDRSADHQIDRLRRDCRDDGGDLFPR